MAITPTSLRTSIGAGSVGAIADTNAEHQAVNDLTAVFNGWTANVAIYISAGAGDQTSALNTWLSNGSGVKQAIGDFNVSDTVVVPAGVYLDLTRGKITQTAADKVTMTLGAKSTLYGGELVGKSSDYSSGASPLAMGVSVGNVDGASIRGTRLTGFSGAAIRAQTATNLSISDVTIVGVGVAYIVSGDGQPCYGILLETGSNTSISNTDISETCQGIIAGDTVTHVTINSVRIHDIRGQHCCYLQNGTALNIAGLDMWNAPAMGCKVQMWTGNTADSVGTSITGVTATGITDIALLVYNVAADLTSTYDYRGVTISNVAAVNCGRGLYLGSVHGGTVTGISVYNCSLDAITLLDCFNITGSAWVVDTCGQVGLRLTSRTGSAMDQIDLDGIRIHNAANGNVASNIYGVYIAQGSNVSMDRLRVTATNGFMQYGLWLASATAGDQQTFALRNADLSGDTGVSARFQTATTTVREWVNNRFSGTITNTPTGITTATVEVAMPWAPYPDVQTFTSGGTWTKPVSVTQTAVIVVAGGSGGGSGRRGAAGTVRCGGGGAGGGGVSFRTIPAANLGSTETVTVGAGGAGGAAVTANDTDGNAGTAGALSTFGAHVKAFASTAGGGGTNAAGTAGAGGAATSSGGAGGAASGTGGAGNTPTSGLGASGGGAGGGITSGDSPSAGGAGGVAASVNRAQSAGAAINTSATPATAAPTGSAEPGLGGGGGGGSIVGAAGAGAAGALYGAGGGGGGASLNGNNSGAGGAGANGIVLAISS